MAKFRDPIKSSRYIQLSLAGGNAPNVSPAGTGRLYYNPSTHALNVSLNAGTARPIPTMLSGTATYDPGSLADGAGATTTVTVTGAALGDIALASFSLDISGISVTAYVSAADTVSVRFQNETTGTLDLAEGTLKAVVFK